jgi:AAA domain
MAMRIPRSEGIELPEYAENPFIVKLPPLFSAKKALEALRELPPFDPAERQHPAHLRAHYIFRLARWFEPLQKDLQLHASIGALIRQGYLGRDIRTGSYTRGLQESCVWIAKRDLNAPQSPICPAAASFALLGCSGMGKTTSVRRILGLYPQVIHHDEPLSLDQVVHLILDCPSGASPKQLCMSFFEKIGCLTDMPYLARYGGRRRSVDEMMIYMAHVAKLHALGVLVIDEIQHLKQARGTGADMLLNFLVTLVNTIGVPVIIVGTTSALPLLQGNFRQARRATGSPVWERMKEGPEWYHFITRMWPYQWTKEVTPLTDEIRQVLYKESQGIIDIVVKLFMLAQRRALELGLAHRPERLEAKLLRRVAFDHFAIIRPMIEALDRGDAEAFDDLRPLQDLVRQLLSDTLVRMSPSYSAS